MEYSIVSNLIEFIFNQYNETESFANTFKIVNDFENGYKVITDKLNLCFGATMFAITLCNKNGYPDLAKEISNQWEKVWEIWFTDLLKEFEVEVKEEEE